MGTMKPWSYSSLTAFETCPKQYNILRNLKQVKEITGEAQIWGTWAHTQLENRLRDNTPLPDSLAYLEPVVLRIVGWPGQLLVEQKLAVSPGFGPAGWWECWARGIIDVAKVNNTKAAILDWKTGKQKPNSEQLALFAAFGFTHYPEVNTITTGFVWLKNNKIDKQTFTRDQLPGIWQGFVQRAARLENAFAKDIWPAKPSGLCKSWCPVGRSRCEFCGKP